MTITIGSAPIRFLAYGDSKTNSWVDRELQYLAEWNFVGARGEQGCYRVGKIAHPGYTTPQLQDAIDADITAYVAPAPTDILMNCGVNDDATTEANFIADYGYILDAFHSKFPLATIYCCKVWTRVHVPECTTIDDLWIPAVLATRSTFAQVGFDERTFIPAGDDGATNTTDGTHLSASGYALWNYQWANILGFHP